LYEASNLGRVRRKGNGRLIAQRLNKQGYAVTTLSIQRHIMVRFIHILVMDAFFGPKPPDHFVQHIDGNKLNNVVSNLRYTRGYSYSGAPAPNTAMSSTPFIPPDKPWIVTEQGFPRFSATSLAELVEAVQQFLSDVNRESEENMEQEEPNPEELTKAAETAEEEGVLNLVETGNTDADTDDDDEPLILAEVDDE